MATHHLDRDFTELYISETSGDRPRIQPRSGYETAHLPHSSDVKQGYRNGLPLYKPVVYPNPDDDSDDDEYEEEANFPPPLPSYQQISQSVPQQYTPGSTYQVSPPGSRINVTSNISPQRVQIVHSGRVGVNPSPVQVSQPHHGERLYTPSSMLPHHTSPVYSSQSPRVEHSESTAKYHLKPSPARMTTVMKPAETYHPQGVSSKILYTTPAVPTQGFVQSRPSNPSSAPMPRKDASQANYVNINFGTDTGTGPASSYPPTTTYSPRNLASPNSEEPTNVEGKEAEVDALTDLLLQNMEAAANPEFFGLCVKCSQPIWGENTGCSALEQPFHITCFTCAGCGIGLGGQPFYSMEGKPYCESCYVNTLEKCSVCSKTITDRVLRATGKPYHPACFMCVVCGKSLDGIPFTVDATNQIHCIEDFHRKFAPRCCVCNLPIMPHNGNEETIRIVAMDKSFHTECYKCEDCNMILSSEAEGRGCYPLDDHILCKHCNAKRIQTMTTKMTTEL